MNGVLVVDKPGGATSHDIVAQARRIFGTRAVGHAGTLDPMATGVLLLLFGEATKLSNFLTRDNKRYLATVRFGRATDTLDADGSTTQEAAVHPDSLTEVAVTAALLAERQRVCQIPPTVSAIKVAGRRAYELTRNGAAPELAERAVSVEGLRLVSQCGTELTIEVHVSKGYYVRALARDLGAALGLPAHLSSLRRLASGQFQLSDAHAWPTDSAAQPISTSEAAQRSMPVATLSESGCHRARLGQALHAADFSSRDEIARDAEDTEAWLSAAGELVALGHERTPGDYRVVRGFRLASGSE